MRYSSRATYHFRELSLLTVLILSAGTVAQAADRYVSPTANNGDGSAAKPWDLQGALNSAKPGDTVWISGGTYAGNFICWTSGTSSNPIIFRASPGERVRLNAVTGSQPGITLQCGNVWFWGLELFFSDTKRTTSQSGSFPTDIKRSAGISTAQTAGIPVNVKFINMIIHDTWGSFGVWTDALNAEIYGNIVFYDGWDAPDRGHGHGIYSQNATGTKRIEDNVMFSAFSYGLHIYSTSDLLQNYIIEGNASFDNGDLSATSGYAMNFFVGGEQDIPKNVTFRNNYSYFSPSRSGGNNQLGSGGGCSNLSVTGNYFITERGTALNKPSRCTSVTMSGNTFLGSLSGFTSSQYPSNTYLTSKPAAPNVFVRPNRYENGRANIIVYNWPMAGSVAVDVSNVLDSGDRYEVRDVQNFYGTPVTTGTYQGGTINVPMGSTSMTPLVGNGPLAPTHTSPEFGVFVLLKTSATSNAAPVVSAGADATITFPNTVALSGSATDDAKPVGSSLTKSWSKVSGPGTVTFSSPSSTTTTASFSAAGNYVLRLTATDSELSDSDDVAVVVNGASSAPNLPPVVDAGQNITITYPNTAPLAGTVSDDGQPRISSSLSATVSLTWSKVSGPGTVTFSNPSILTPVASFSTKGTYVLKLTASDSLLSSSDQVTVQVNAQTSSGAWNHMAYISAEAGILTAPMVQATASGLQGGKSVTKTVIKSSQANSGVATYTITVPATGTYYLWGRIVAKDSSADSFYVSVNGGAEDVYDMAEGIWSPNWQWTKVNGRNGDMPNTIPQRAFSLNAGANTLRIRARDANSVIDRLAISGNPNFAPQ